MAKTIKFNLVCDGNPVRTLEDLQNNFSIEDVLAYYHNGLLHRWLCVRGYEKELKAVSSISRTEPMDIIKELIQIFDVVVDAKEVEESIYILQYLEERKERCACYEKENYNTTHIIADYEDGYHQLVRKILDNPKDSAIIKAAIEEMATNYAWILQLNHRSLFFTLKVRSPLALMCLLMNEKTRYYYLPVERKKEDGTTILDIETDCDKKDMFEYIRNIVKNPIFLGSIKDEVVSFSGVTDGYWKDLEPKGKKYMIISMGSGDYVRSSGNSGGDLSSTDVTDKFVILDGIDYKSNSNVRKLTYMEV